MIYEFRFSAEEDPEVYKMVIEADTRSNLLYNILNNQWDTEQIYFDDTEIIQILENIFDRLMNADPRTYSEDLYDFLMRCQFKLDLRRFLGENSNESLQRLLHLFGECVCNIFDEESGGLDFEYEFLER
jgi:hypothetical protein